MCFLVYPHRETMWLKITYTPVRNDTSCFFPSSGNWFAHLVLDSWPNYKISGVNNIIRIQKIKVQIK